MDRHEDREFEEALKRSLGRDTDSLVFTQAMKDRVVRTIHQQAERRQAGLGARIMAPIRRQRHRLLRVGTAIAAGIAGVALAVHLLAPTTPGVTERFGLLHATSGTSNTASSTETTSFAGTVAPVDTQDVTLVKGAWVKPSTHDTHQGLTQAAGTKGNVQGTDKALVPTFPELTKQAFTVQARLFNTSNQPIDGRDLQGMIFLMSAQSGLSPNSANDWEYFVDGPDAIIPPHQSVVWYFSPNPSPPFTSLGNRYVHFVWLLRQPNPNYPTRILGTLPIVVNTVKVRVTGHATDAKTSVTTQFLTVTAKLTNQSGEPFSLSSALGMLFFRQGPGASLLDRSTYKYFDDVTPVRAGKATLQPGQSGMVKFVITGVPGANMLTLPLSIYLVPRSQVGL